MAKNIIRVAIVGDSRSLENAAKRSNSALGNVGNTASKWGKTIAKGVALGVGAGVAGVALFAKTSVNAASDLGESLSKSNVVFGQNASAIETWSKSSAKNIGISQQQALEAAGTFGNLFRAMDLGTQPAANMSKSLVGLAGDLASFNNADPTEVLDALRAGLVGETEPLRRFGVNISAARIEAEALRLGLAKGNVDMVKVETATLAVEKAQRKAAEALKAHGANSLEFRDAQAAVARAEQGVTKALAGSKVELTAGQKAQASYSLIMKDTALAQGDFERTSGGLANRTRIVKAQIADLSAKFGSALLPVILVVANFVSDTLVPGIQALGGAFANGDVTSDGFVGTMERIGVVLRKVVRAIAPVAKDIGELFVRLAQNKPVLIAVGAAIGGILVTAFVAWAVSAAAAAAATIAAAAPVLLIGAALGLLVLALVKAWQNCETFRNIVLGVVRAVKAGFTAFVNGAISLWNRFGGTISGFVKTYFGAIKATIQGVLNIIIGIVKVFVALFTGNWTAFFNGIKQIASGGLGALGGIFRGAIAILTAPFRIVMDTIRGNVDNILGFFTSLPSLIEQAISGVGNILLAPFKIAWNAIASLWNNTVGRLSFKIPSWVPGIGGKGFDMPDIPTLHTGGIFNSGRGEGAAWLRDGEGVFTPQQMAAMGGGRGGDFIMNVATLTPASLNAAQRRWDKRNGRR